MEVVEVAMVMVEIGAGIITEMVEVLGQIDISMVEIARVHTESFSSQHFMY